MQSDQPLKELPVMLQFLNLCYQAPLPQPFTSIFITIPLLEISGCFVRDVQYN